MAVDDRFARMLGEIKGLREQARETVPLRDGGGGGTSGGMEERVRRLETAVDGLKDRVGDLRVEIAALKVKVDHLPTKGFIVAADITMVTGIAGLLVLLQKLGILT